MALPEVTITVVDGQLGLSGENIDGIHVTLGVCSAGIPNTFYSFSSSSDVPKALGRGPLVEALAYKLDLAGGPQYAVPITASVAGTSTVPVAEGVGAPAVTLTGAPFDAFEGSVRIVSDGTLGNATFQFALDGTSWSEIITTAATYAVPDSGLVLNFAAGTYTTAHSYSWTSTAPYYNLVNLNAAFAALLADNRKWRFVHVLGAGATAADTAAVCAALQAHMEAARAQHRFVSAIAEAAPDTASNLIAAFASVAAGRVMLVVGQAPHISRVSGQIFTRPHSWGVAMRAAWVGQKATVGIASHLGRVLDGPISGYLQELDPDEFKSPGLDAQRFTTLRTIVGKPGVYVTRGRTLAPFGSDFMYWENLQVINKACTIVRDVMLNYLNDEVSVKEDGTIGEGEAQKIENACLSRLTAEMVAVRNVTAAFAVVNRGINIVSTRKLMVAVKVRPLGYAEDISVEIGFDAPRAIAA